MPSTFRLLTLVFISCFSFGFVHAQTGQVSGTITDGTDPLPYATVVLKKANDSSMVKAEITNMDGAYAFKQMQYDRYFVEVSYVGMTAYTSEAFDLNQAEFKQAPVAMSTAVELEGVDVVAMRPMVEVLADKTVFNVENTLNATGTNGFELLRKAPGVVIDNNNNVILEGKTGVQVYINGKPSPLAGDDLINFLRSLQSSDIESIEIITQPSAKYDAAGNAGIIDIKLKKDKNLGTNGTVAGGVERGRNTRYNSSISLNNRTKKVNLYGNYSNNLGDRWNEINLYRTQEGVRYDAETEMINSNEAHNVRAGIDVFPHRNHTVGVLLNANIFDSDMTGSTITPITPLSTGQVSSILVANNEATSDNSNMAGNFNYMFADTSGHELGMDFDYGQYERDNLSYQPNEYLDPNGELLLQSNNYRMKTLTVIDIVTAKIDYSQNLFGGKFSFGGKYSNIETANTFQFYDVTNNGDVLNADRSNVFDYTENINAGYVNFNKKVKKVSVQVGVRAEQTISEGILTSTQSSVNDRVKRNYLDWFPSGGVSYAPNFKHSWALNYSRRIQRPNYQSLNPFESQLTELDFRRGNPFLQPQYTNNVKLSHTFKYRMTTSIGYSRVDDFFAEVTDTLGNGSNFIMTRNIANQDIYSFGFSYPFEVKKWWSVYMNINAFHASYTASDEKYQAVDQSTFNLFAQNSFLLPKNFKFEVSGWYSSPSVWGGTYLTKSMGSLDMAVQKTLADDKLNVRLAVADIFYTAPWRAEGRFGDLYITGNGGWESRVVRLNVSYRFGSNEVKKTRNRKTGLEEEGSRVQ